MKIQRIYILGASGSGKSYLAKLVSDKLKIPCYDLDDVFWVKKYSKKLDEDKRVEELRKIVKSKSWVIEGVYTSWVSEAVKSADLIIWLKVPVHKRVSRIIKRKLRGEDKADWGEVLELAKFTLGYRVRRERSSHLAHKKLLKENNVNHIDIKSKKDFYNFLEV